MAMGSCAWAKDKTIADCHGGYHLNPPAPGSQRYLLLAVRRAGDDEREWAQIRDVATDRLAAQFELPQGPNAAYDPGAFTVGADDRSFFLHIRSKRSDSAPNDYYRVRINDAGHVVQTCRILQWLISDYGFAKEVSVSPDGTRLAFADTDPTAYHGPAPDSMMVADVVTRQRWTWDHPGEIWYIGGLSWLPDGRRIVFWDFKPRGFGRILDTTRSGDPAKISTPIDVTSHDPRFGRLHSGRWINQDGTTLYLTVQHLPATGASPWTGVAEFDLATGRQRRILFQTPQVTVSYHVEGTCLSGDGRFLFVVINDRVHQIDTATGQDRPLPFGGGLLQRFAC